MLRYWLTVIFAFASLAAGLFATYYFSLNKIERENTFRIGTSDWEIVNPVTRKSWVDIFPDETTSSDAEIEGYASATSVNIGEEIIFYVRSEQYQKLETFRLGWYRGRGARRIRTDMILHSSPQPECKHDQNTNRVECDWQVTRRLTIPENWVSGVYLVRLTALDSGHQSYITYVVRDDERESDFLFQTSVTTYQAYNRWGGYSLYEGRNNKNRASEVSFDRPYDQGYGSEGHEGAGDLLRWEINMLRWMEREGYDLTYATNIDMHHNPNLLAKRSAFLSVGHDEYWTNAMRTHLEDSLDSCVNLGFFSANSIYWRADFAPNTNGDPLRTLISNKSCVGDPLTGEWRDNCGGRIEAQPEDALIGVKWENPIHMDNDLIVQNTDHWVFEGTGLANGERLIGLVGYEADRLGSSTPSGLTVLGDSPTCPDICRSRGSSASCGPVTRPCDCGRNAEGASHMTIYETDKGAKVFATGTIQWAWGLDDYESPQDSTPHCSRVQAPVQQITRNVLNGLKTRSECH